MNCHAASYNTKKVRALLNNRRIEQEMHEVIVKMKSGLIDSHLNDKPRAQHSDIHSKVSHLTLMDFLETFLYTTRTHYISSIESTPLITQSCLGMVA